MPTVGGGPGAPSFAAVSPGGEPADESSDAVSPRVERAAVIAMIAVRSTFCAQLALSLRPGVGHANRPWLFVLLSTLALAESSLLMGLAWRHRRITSTMAFLDLAFACLVIAAEPGYSSPQDRVGTWVAWGFGAGCAATITVGAGLRRRRDATAAALALAVTYVAVSIATPRPVAAVVNAVALVGFVAASHTVAGFLRELASIADQARAAATRAAREAERERQRGLLHDQATVLALLSHQHDNPVLEGNLRLQAAQASHRIRAFLGDERTTVSEQVSSQAPPLLVDVVSTATGAFSDLPITINTDLVPGLRVRSEQADPLREAVRTLLHNVRSHARATTVVVHADQTSAGGWELSVADDGVGFDPATTTFGYGLRTQLGQALTAAGFTVTVDSAPADGTRVVITSPKDPL